MNKKLVFIAFVVSLGGFLFGFDAGIISGVMSFASPEFNGSSLIQLLYVYLDYEHR
jgi:hypothetical protein